MNIGIGKIRRSGGNLILESKPGSSIDAEISISAGEVLRTIARILLTPAGLAFVLGLPFFWLREKFGTQPTINAPSQTVRRDINKPW